MDCSMPVLPVLHYLLEFAQTHVHGVEDDIQPFRPLLTPSSTLNLTQDQGLFQLVGSLHQVAKVLEFSFCISPSNEYSVLISFKINWFDLLAVQGTLKSLLQHHNLKYFHILFHYSLLENIEYTPLCYTVGSCCLSILYVIVSSANPKLLICPSLTHFLTAS